MANIARDAQVIRESVQTVDPNARVVQVFRESIIIPAVFLTGNALAIHAGTVSVPQSVSVSVTGTSATATAGSPLFPNARDTQVIREAILLASPNARSAQVVREAIILRSPDVSVSVTGLAAAATAGTVGIVATIVRGPQPSQLLHPLVKPLDFYTSPPKQPGKRSASFTTLLTQAGAQRAFSMPLGARNQPIAGKVFSFTMGGTIIPGTVGGQMTITPLYGATADGVNLGPSISQAYSASTAPMPWRLKGEIIFQAVDLTPGASLVVCTGSFTMDDVAIVFGSANPIQVDAGAVSPSASGALNFAVTFAPAVLNVSPPVISTKYAFLR
jgi:hypothetical protein